MTELTQPEAGRATQPDEGRVAPPENERARNLSPSEVELIAKAVPGDVAVYLVADKLECLYISPELAGFAGITEAVKDALPKADSALGATGLGVAGLGVAGDIEFNYRAYDGESTSSWFHVHGRWIGKLEGKPVLLCVFINASLENVQQRSLVDFSDSPTYVVDWNSFEILYMNKASIKLFGGQVPKPGQTCHEYKHGVDKPCPWCPILQMKTTQAESARLDEFFNVDTGRWHQYDYRRLPWFGHDAVAVYAFDITDRKRELNQIEDDRRVYREAVRTAQMIVWEYDIAEHRITMSGDESGIIDNAKFGFRDVIENVPECFNDLIDDDCLSAFMEMYRKVAAGEDASCEVWYRHRQGREPRCERVSYTVVRDDRGVPVRAYGIGQNVTAQRKAEERYRRETEMLRTGTPSNLLSKSHVDLTRDVVLEYDATGDLPVLAIPGAGYEESLAKLAALADRCDNGRPLAETLSRENLMRNYLDGESSLSLTYQVSARGYAPAWVMMSVNLYMSPSSGDLEFFAYAYDITDKALERQIISKLSDLGYDELGFVYPTTGAYTTYHIDRHGGVVTKNSGGYDSEVERRLCTPAIPTETLPFMRAALSLSTVTNALELTRVYSFSASVKREGWSDRRKLFRFSYLDDRRDAIFFCMSDITDQHQDEIARIAELEAAKLDADKANEAKSSFLSSMSHDLRTPLNGVIGFTDLAIREEDPLRKQEYLMRIKSSGKLLLDLVNDTLDLSRIESGKMTFEPEAVDGHGLVDAVITAIRPMAELKNIHLDYSSDIPEETIWIDKLKFQKVFLNLLSNAVKYTPDGGKVHMIAQVVDPPCGGCNRRVIVEDDGIGMTPEFQERMFEPFAQEKRPEAKNVAGTGLGLSIVDRIVGLMGGSIDVRSEVGKGTRLTVDLPVELAGEGQLQAEAAAVAEWDILKDKRVLLVEDNWMNVEIAQILLGDKGVVVETAGDGAQALEAFVRSEVGHFDLILMDIRMPIMDGREATRAIRALDRPDATTVPIVALTADAFEDDIRKNHEAGMNAHVTKPFESERLYDVLSEMLK